MMEKWNMGIKIGYQSDFIYSIPVANLIKTDLIPSNAGFQYSNTPLFQPVPPKLRLCLTKADTPWHLFTATALIHNTARGRGQA